MSASHKKMAIICGGGPAGLTAAYELLEKTDIHPIVLEKTGDIGGISKTVNYKGNRIDIGGHRFFSKSDRVMEWWMNILPLENREENEFTISYQNKHRTISPGQLPTTGADKDKVMLVRSRLSRIYFLKQFFSYPVSLSFQTLSGLGLKRSMKIFFSYMKAMLFPIREEKSLEDFMINRFGKELYNTFFKDYTEKVWGIACNKISADWGAQRIKGLDIKKAVIHALQSLKKKDKDINQKGTETSLIERFLYPKYGPGQIWEEVARIVAERSGEPVQLHQEVVKIYREGNKVHRVDVRDSRTGEVRSLDCDYFFSTMPIKQFVESLEPPLPSGITEIGSGLLYRDFLTVGLLLHKLRIRDNKQLPESNDNMVKDNWIYIQEKDVKVGRLQIFNNWSPYMVANPDHVWIGMEYFCNEGDELWNMEDEKLKAFAIEELDRIEIIRKEDVIDSTVLRMEKAYPAYFGTYDKFDELKEALNGLDNVYFIGRNGMHRYNNSDHSMLTAMYAVESILENNKNKAKIWDVNTEQEYHEKK